MSKLLVAVIFSTLAMIPVVAQQSQPTDQNAPDMVIEEVQPPQIILDTQQPPDYPPAALAGRINGQVMLGFRVLENGKVDEVKVLKCTQKNLGFEQAAMKAIKKWRFEPATVDGDPVEYEMRFRMNFNYKGGPTVSGGALSNQQMSSDSPAGGATPIK